MKLGGELCRECHTIRERHNAPPRIGEKKKVKIKINESLVYERKSM